MNPPFLLVATGVSIALMVLLVTHMFQGLRPSEAEARLDAFEGKATTSRRAARGHTPSILRPDRPSSGGGWLDRLASAEGLARLYEQADIGLAPATFFLVAAGLAVLAGVVAFLLGLAIPMAIVASVLLGGLPFLWLVSRRGKRIKAFTTQMPDALELVGRALRAGHGLGAGLRVVAEEMPAPISQEFGRVAEEQNLGLPLEEALRGLSVRIPTMDVRFFVTAVVIQRSTGGDLAEVLDKIGRLIRERFQILGQVRALTGEGRISGAVLLAMPPALLALVSVLNPDYVGLLFNTEIGKKMLLITAGLQLIGAAAIKKIVSIEV